MNKKLLALAIGAAVAMPVSAVAAPTLYGQINVSLEQTDIDIPGTTVGDVDQWDIQNNASRLGVKGEAETGVDGLKGVYLAEYDIKADDGVGPFTQRNIYAGLAGSFGKVLVGRIDTPTKTVQGKVDQFNDSTVDMANYLAGDRRADNNITYVSPKIADTITASVALIQGEGAVGPAGGTDVNDAIGDEVSASVAYNNEGLYLGLGLDKEVTRVGGVELTGTYNDIIRLVAGYTADNFEVGFLYQTAEGADSGNKTEDTSMLLSGAMISGDWKFKAQYIITEGDDGTAAADDEDTVFALGADYALGKSTTVYGFLAMGETGVGSATTDANILSFGLLQKF